MSYVIEKGTAMLVAGCTKPGLGEITDTKVRVKDPNEYRYTGDMRLHKGKVYVLFSHIRYGKYEAFEVVVAQPA